MRLKGREWAPCQVTTFLVSPNAFRRYTPDAVDTVTGRMSILFYRQAQRRCPGPAFTRRRVAGQPCGRRPGLRNGAGGDAKLQPGEALLSRLGDAPPQEVTHAYLSGHGQTIQRARHVVRTRYDLHRSVIYTQPYWATGKVGL